MWHRDVTLDLLNVVHKTEFFELFNFKCALHFRHKRDTSHKRTKRQSFDPKQYDRMMSIIYHKTGVNKDNCNTYKPEDLQLPGDVGYNVEVLFSNQARTALRLSHFLSNFLQNIDMYEEYGNLRGDRLLNVEQVSIIYLLSSLILFLIWALLLA